MSSHFGEWLKAERKKRGWTQDQLAAEVDLSKAQVSRLEAGHQGTKRPTAVRIAEILGVDPHDALDALKRDTPGLAEKDQEEELVFKAGRKARLIEDDGTLGEPVEIDDQMVAVVKALVRSKQRQ